jgi:glycosyltransferase involved in cell wall biosynthesis
MKFSIIIPTYNEAADIRNTLKEIVSQDWKDFETIVVDDSTDETPLIVSEFSSFGVRLIRPSVRKGRCEARNIGMKAASGDILVILNADVLLPAHFLRDISKYYEQGYDSVSVMNSISNVEMIYARYIEAKRQLRIEQNVYNSWAQSLGGVFWTEGFSVRREMAFKTRLFPSGFSVPIEAGEDARFAADLREAGCKGYFAADIVVPHVSPGTLSEFWSVRIGRGAGTPQIRYFLDAWPHWKISLWRYAKAAERIAKILTVFPILYSSYRLAKSMRTNVLKETAIFTWVSIVEEIAKTVGEHRSHIKVRRLSKPLAEVSV